MQYNRPRQLFSTLMAVLLLLPALGVQAQDTAPSDRGNYALKPVTPARLLNGTTDPSAWLMYGGNYQSWRFSPLTDINRQNVQHLRAAWLFQTGIPNQLQASPVIAGGILYLTTAYNHLHALDAETGQPLWKYDHPLPDDMRVCCGPGNRGVAIASDKVFMGTLDARLVAFDRLTGAVVWNVKVDE